MSDLAPEQVTQALERTVGVLENEAIVSMEKAVELTWQRMSELAPKGETGELARDIAHTVRKTSVGVSGTVRPLSAHAGFVNYGTGQGKTLRGSHGEAYSATSGLALNRAEELADPFAVATATGWGSKTPGRPLAIHLPGGVIFRPRVRGQRARQFVEHTREETAPEVETVLTAGAERATARLFG